MFISLQVLSLQSCLYMTDTQIKSFVTMNHFMESVSWTLLLLRSHRL